MGVLVAVVVGLLPAAAKAGTLTSGSYNGPVGSIPYELYVPSSYTAGRAMPMVVALHGCSQTADSFRQQTRWDQQAEAKGFIALFPQQDSSNNYLTCWNFFLDSSMHRGAGDPARIAAVTSLVENTYNVDPHQVYVAGFSAGGGMASVMGATYPDYFAAIGIESGCEYAAGAACAGYQSADPTTAGQQAHTEMGPRAHAMPFIAFQGSQDQTVPPVNGQQLVQQWLTTDAMADGAAASSVSTSPAKSSFGVSPGGRSYTVSTYDDSRQAELGQYWLVQGMGHAWSGGSSSEPYSDPSGPDATSNMYAFFQNHPDMSLSRPAPPPTPPPAAPAASKPNSKGKARVPRVSKPRMSHGRIVFRISGPGSVTLRLQRRVAGHVRKGHCVKGKGKRHPCTMNVTKTKIVFPASKARRFAIAVPKKVRGHRLPRGRYRAVLTPADPAGHSGRSQTVLLAIR